MRYCGNHDPRFLFDIRPGDTEHWLRGKVYGPPAPMHAYDAHKLTDMHMVGVYLPEPGDDLSGPILVTMYANGMPMLVPLLWRPLAPA